jgi:hypothetical protein
MLKAKPTMRTTLNQADLTSAGLKVGIVPGALRDRHHDNSMLLQLWFQLSFQHPRQYRSLFLALQIKRRHRNQFQPDSPVLKIVLVDRGSFSVRSLPAAAARKASQGRGITINT